MRQEKIDSLATAQGLKRALQEVLIDNFELKLRVSDIAHYNRCQRSFSFSKLGFSPQVEGKRRTALLREPENFDKGTLIHHLYALHQTHGLDLEDIDKTREVVLGHAMEMLGVEDPLMFESSPTWVKCFNDVTRSAYGYPKWASQDSVFAFAKKIFAEQTLSTSWHQSAERGVLEVTLEGHPDLLILEQDDTWTVPDHKSSAGTPQTLVANNPQLLAYAWLVGLNKGPVRQVAHIHTKINGRTRAAKPPYFIQTRHYLPNDSFMVAVEESMRTTVCSMGSEVGATHSITEMCNRTCRYKNLCSLYDTDRGRALQVIGDTYVQADG